MLECVLWIAFWISAFIAFYAMVGYPLSLFLIDKIKKTNKLKKDIHYEPSVTYMIVAHNEEKLIQEKLENAISLEYPREKFSIIVASDNSTDKTNSIVEKFIAEHQEYSISLYCSREHKGKTNAQNEAQKMVTSEILVMTDANTIMKKDCIHELVSSFVSDDISYVCGKLVYSNKDTSMTSDAESTYWDLELKMRDIESRIKTIVAGNGAVYACRNSRYVDFAPKKCHDTEMPYYYGTHKQKAIFNPDAIAYEKAGENAKDEFNRKVRMNRNLTDSFKRSFLSLNFFRYGWLTFFYFGHRTCRQCLWLAHLVAFMSSLILGCIGSLCGIIFFCMQLLWVAIIAIHMRREFSNKLLRMLGYYGMTVAAQYVAIYKLITGQSKAVWEKAESTR